MKPKSAAICPLSKKWFYLIKDYKPNQTVKMEFVQEENYLFDRI